MDKNYILIIGWVAVMAMLSVLTSVKQEETVCGKKEYRWRPVWAVVTVLPLVWMCSQRGGIMDTGAYLEGYKDMPRAFGGIVSYIGTVKKDKGFYCSYKMYCWKQKCCISIYYSSSSGGNAFLCIS